MVGLYGGSPIGYAAIEEQGSDAVSSGIAAGAAGSEGLALNLTGRLFRAHRRGLASPTEGPPPSPLWAPQADSGAAADLAARAAEDQTPALLDADTANAQYEIPGVLKFDKPVAPFIARDLYEAKKAKIERDDAIARSEGGIVAGAARISAALGASLLDPINVAAGFIPIIGPAREAALIAQASGALGRAGIRAGVGAGAGAVGMAALQPLEFALSRQEREDYTMADALRSIALGTVLGGGLHAGVGGAIDRATGRYRNPISQRIEDAGPDARETALRGALAQTIEGRPVEVAPVFDAADPAIRTSHADMLTAARREPEVEPQARVMADEAAARPDDTLQTLQKEIADLEIRLAPPETPVARAGAPEAARPTEVAPTVEQPAIAVPAAAGAPTIGEPVAAMRPHRVATADGGAVDVAPVVVEARDLRTSADAGYDATLQPRNRDRAAAEQQVREMASRIEPERLGASAEADRGAPIVGPDGMVESGNGRVMALRQAYADGNAQGYRDWLAAQGVDVARYDQPVLVRQRLTEMTPAERQAFTVAANRPATLALSAPERALADAQSITTDMLDLVRNVGNLGAVANRDFVRSFVSKLPQTEQGTIITAGGDLSAEGLTRVRNAVLAKAYGDTPDGAALLSRIAESTHDEIKSISNALVSAAPLWARLRADIEAGLVRPDVDLTSQLLEAVRRTADLRTKGVKLADALAQQDAFDQLPRPVEAWMRMFYDGGGRRAAAASKISERLTTYATEARKVSAEQGLDLGIAPVTAGDLQRIAGRADGGEPGLLFGGGAGDGANRAGTAGRSGVDAGGRGLGGEGGGSARPREVATRPAELSPEDIFTEARVSAIDRAALCITRGG